MAKKIGVPEIWIDVESRQLRRRRNDEQRTSATAHEKPEHSAADGEERALEQQLSHDIAVRRAECASNRRARASASTREAEADRRR